ncbi:hypothetical protein BB561_001509 [Smittium simulii]|uniref:Uncharacterized protein n=1 Tax=Smittium simulii TaxID=133385 RepID=A0A2T9YUB1_9FUNG|nr:hypothetical protein BB561_001509 [Smittium simulii]
MGVNQHGLESELIPPEFESDTESREYSIVFSENNENGSLYSSKISITRDIFAQNIKNDQDSSNSTKKFDSALLGLTSDIMKSEAVQITKNTSSNIKQCLGSSKANNCYSLKSNRHIKKKSKKRYTKNKQMYKNTGDEHIDAVLNGSFYNSEIFSIPDTKSIFTTNDVVNSNNHRFSGKYVYFDNINKETPDKERSFSAKSFQSYNQKIELDSDFATQKNNHDNNFKSTVVNIDNHNNDILKLESRIIINNLPSYPISKINDNCNRFEDLTNNFEKSTASPENLKKDPSTCNFSANSKNTSKKSSILKIRPMPSRPVKEIIKEIEEIGYQSNGNSHLSLNNQVLNTSSSINILNHSKSGDYKIHNNDKSSAIMINESYIKNKINCLNTSEQITSNPIAKPIQPHHKEAKTPPAFEPQPKKLNFIQSLNIISKEIDDDWKHKLTK